MRQAGRAAAGAPGAPQGPQGLPGLRAEIDAIDDALLELLGRRARVAAALGRLKADLLPESSGRRLRDREAAVLERLARANRGPLPAGAIAAIFDEIFRACLDVQAGGAGALDPGGPAPSP